MYDDINELIAKWSPIDDPDGLQFQQDYEKALMFYLENKEEEVEQ